jgi:hypothetical protein
MGGVMGKITANERLRDLIHGGPGDRHLWTVMVILGARANAEGIVEKPQMDEVAEWIGKSEQWATWVVRELERQGWIHQFDEAHWDIGQNLRKGRAEWEPNF